MSFTHFYVIDDFNAQSAKPSCYISNLPKMKKRTVQQSDAEVDPFILRGPEIDFEGYMDIRPAVILETARELGMATEEEFAALKDQYHNALEDNKRLRRLLETEIDRNKALTLKNAEQIVQEEALTAELEAAYADLYDEEADAE